MPVEPHTLVLGTANVGSTPPARVKMPVAEFHTQRSQSRSSIGISTLNIPKTLQIQSLRPTRVLSSDQLNSNSTSSGPLRFSTSTSPGPIVVHPLHRRTEPNMEWVNISTLYKHQLCITPLHVKSPLGSLTSRAGAKYAVRLSSSTH